MGKLQRSSIMLVKDYKGMVLWKKMPYGNWYRFPADNGLNDYKGKYAWFPWGYDIVDLLRYFSYILADLAYDASDIYDYVFENTHALPIIDTNTYIRLSHVIFYLWFNDQYA